MYQLRDYQTEAVKAAFEWIKKNRSPCLLELATGAGKSLICAELALLMVMQSGKKALCLCPTAELVEQNSEKYALTGEKFSIYSASISKSLVHNAVFATEGSFKSVAEEQGDKFALVIIDEAHRITPTIKKIIEEMKKKNPNLRVIGMTGTPYRLGTGYIYEQDENGSQIDDAKNPYFKRLVYKVGGELLVDRGYITKPIVGLLGVEGYDTSKLSLGRTNNFSAEDLDEAFCGDGKKTAAIVADVIKQANTISARGVMFFAATVRHAKEIMASLPAYNSALVTGETPKKERKRIIRDYKNQKIKYLVNVAVLTTGFDAPHTDLIAILRATESAALLTQIIGRGLRLFDGKEFCLILDYAKNIEKFFPDKNLFNPKIKAFGDKPAIKDEFTCEKCNFPSTFTLRPNPDGYDIDSFGYFKDGAGDRMTFDGMGFPAHYGRRCTHLHRVGHDQFERCDYFWSFKACHECDSENDIAARVCGNCGSQLIDPNDKLAFDFNAFKNDLKQLQTDKVLSIIKKRPKLGLILWIVETEHRKIEVFFSQKVNKKFYEIVNDKAFLPKTISYKQTDSKYFIISDFNRQEDKP